MSIDNRIELRDRGFEGFVPISVLQSSKCREIPKVPGVYCVLRLITTPPEFRDQSTGGHFKRKNPTVAVDQLRSKWVDNALVLNIGKAGGKGKATLKRRISQYMRFGQGITVGHQGGRYIWQLQDSQDLIVCWRPAQSSHPRDVERALLREFEEIYGRLPFANLRH